MMNQEAIKLIQAINASNFEQLEATDRAVVVIPNNSSVVSLEEHMDMPNDHIAHYATHVLEEFATYSKTQLHDTSAIYINTELMSALAIFDHGNFINPMRGKNIATLMLKKTPGFCAVCRNNGHIIDQQSLIDFFTDWQENISFFDDQNMEINFLDTINRFRRVTVKSTQQGESEQQNFNKNLSAMESIEVSAGSEKLPAYFIFYTEPHDGFLKTQFICNLRAMTDEKKISFKYRIERLDAQIEAIANEFRNKINEQLPGATIYIGTMDHR